MRISEIFAMGGDDGRRDESCNSGCYSGYSDGGSSDGGSSAGRESLDDPRLRRTGLAAIIGSSSDGGSGLLGIFSSGR